ncbi:deoxyribodipyrimidine photo-lyase [Peptostreptococcaceae bacterium AGR-M142]
MQKDLIGIEYLNRIKTYEFTDEEKNLNNKENINETRMKIINKQIDEADNKNNLNKYIIYWMQQSCRTKYNHALEFAIKRANLSKLPLIVYFGLTKDYKEANERHYTFLLEGLKDVQDELFKRNIKFIMVLDNPKDGLIKFLDDAKELVMDRGYLKIQRLWREQVLNYANKIKLNSYIVESDVIVPIEEVSSKEEYGARTIRKKIHDKLDLYLKPLREEKININIDKKLEELISKKHKNIVKIDSIDELLKDFDIDKTVKKSKYYKGGQKRALKVFKDFLENKLTDYDKRNHPELDYCSNLSMYLHFGQISVLYIVLKTMDYYKNNYIKQDSYDSFLEEIIVRRDLAINFVYYNNYYDDFRSITYNWAYETMDKHKTDYREYEYSLDDIENYKTHDKYFNAAMKEMVLTGKMHTYMRMYWCKKILEWVSPYKKAYDISLYLNNKYFIDGRDANSYTGVAWCFGKHDRAFKEREVFGKLRYMNDKGLKRKFDMDLYIKKIDKLK